MVVVNQLLIRKFVEKGNVKVQRELLMKHVILIKKVVLLQE